MTWSVCLVRLERSSEIKDRFDAHVSPDYITIRALPRIRTDTGVLKVERPRRIELSVLLCCLIWIRISDVGAPHTLPHGGYTLGVKRRSG
jgi:hypothetical protein